MSRTSFFSAHKMDKNGLVIFFSFEFRCTFFRSSCGKRKKNEHTQLKVVAKSLCVEEATEFFFFFQFSLSVNQRERVMMAKYSKVFTRLCVCYAAVCVYGNANRMSFGGKLFWKCFIWMLPAHFRLQQFSRTQTCIHRERESERESIRMEAKNVCRNSIISISSSINSNQTENTDMPKHRTQYTHTRMPRRRPNRTNHNTHNVIAYLVALVLSNIRHWERKYLSSPHDIFFGPCECEAFIAARALLRSMHSTLLLNIKKNICFIWSSLSRSKFAWRTLLCCARHARCNTFDMYTFLSISCVLLFEPLCTICRTFETLHNTQTINGDLCIAQQLFVWGMRSTRFIALLSVLCALYERVANCCYCCCCLWCRCRCWCRCRRDSSVSVSVCQARLKEKQRFQTILLLTVNLIYWKISDSSCLKTRTSWNTLHSHWCPIISGCLCVYICELWLLVVVVVLLLLLLLPRFIIIFIFAPFHSYTSYFSHSHRAKSRNLNATYYCCCDLCVCVCGNWRFIHITQSHHQCHLYCLLKRQNVPLPLFSFSYIHFYRHAVRSFVTHL